jgi:hypothetical protein
MRLEQHPEYIQSLRDREIVARCAQAVEAWKADGLSLEVPAYGLSWTPASALSLVRALQALFHAYNRVLWEQFPYCPACGGQCCVNEASHVGPFDGLALALLGVSLPDLPPQLPTTDRACIYLAARTCSLPAEWRTIKCWSFFCLGGLWDPAVPLGEHYHELTAALKAVLHAHLQRRECAALRRYEQVRGDLLADHLHDPADLAGALDDALWEVLVGALQARYPLLDTQTSGLSERGPLPDSRAEAGALYAAPAAGQRPALEEERLAFIVEAMEQVLDAPPSPPKGLLVPSAQLLEDLESLEWIIVGHPARATQHLQSMAARYAAAPGPTDGEQPSIWYRMYTCLAHMLETYPRNQVFKAKEPGF